MQSGSPTGQSEKVICTTLCLSLILCLITVTGFAWENSQAQAVVRVLPVAEWVRIGKTTVVDLTVEQVIGLYGAEVHLSFDPEALEVVDLDPEKAGVQIEPGTLPHPDFIVLNQADNKVGTIDYAATQMPPRKPKDGQGLIARVTFRAKKATTSQIEVDQFLLADTTGRHIDALPQPAQIEVRDYSVLIAMAAGAGVAVLGLGAVGFAYRKRK